jgi:hypothetical protein
VTQFRTMYWKALAAFICIQTAGAWCICTSTGHADLRVFIGWWLLLLPGSFVALFVPFGWGFYMTIGSAVSVNAILWYTMGRAVWALRRK